MKAAPGVACGGCPPREAKRADEKECMPSETNVPADGADIRQDGTVGRALTKHAVVGWENFAYGYPVIE